MHADEEERLIPGQSKSYYVLVISIIVGLLLAAALGWYFYQRSQTNSKTLADIAASEQAGPGMVEREAEEKDEMLEPPPLLEPIETTAEYAFPPDLPDLEDSDSELQKQLAPLSESGELTTWLQSDDVARKGVAAVYSLADGEVAYEYLALPPPKGKFKVTSKNNKTYIDEKNFKRYDSIVKAVDNIDVDYAAAFYVHYWPLFRKAFGELGEPDKSLQTEVMTAIDLLLETPEVDGDIELNQPSVYYKFVDKDLEKLKPAQKLLLRMGPENRAIIKQKLTDIKDKLDADEVEDAAVEEDSTENSKE